MPATEHIAVLLDGLDEAHAAVVGGIKRYRDSHRLVWDIRIVSPDQAADQPVDTWWVMRCKAHLDRIPTGTDQNRVCSLLGTPESRSRICCDFDEAIFGELAARHLHEQGYRHAGTVDIGVRERFDERRDGFVAECARLGLGYEHFVRRRGPDVREIDAALVAWVRSRPQPFALYAVIDGQATWMRDMLIDHGVRIPEEVAVLGTGDHTSTCVAREPELSSVAYPWGLMGEVAGHHLHHVIQGSGRPPPRALRPFRVAARASTRSREPDDPLVARTLAWLEAHLASPHPLADLVKVLGVSDPTLCRRFKAALDSSPKREHDRLRVEKAARLLAEKHLPVAAVAKRCGFSSSTALGVAFKRRRGCTPTQWRAALG